VTAASENRSAGSSTPDAAAPPTPVLRNKWLALAAVSLGVATTILNATVSNVAIPAIAADIGLSTTAATWVNAGYALTFASLLLLSGRIADRIGRRKLFVIGVTVFALASIAIALAPSVPALITARIVQGAAASTILPSSLSLINAVFRGRDRAIAFAVWGSIIGGVSALGPLIGGWIIEVASWEWAFLINLPIAAVTIAMALRFVPDSKEDRTDQRMDIGGAILATAGVALLVFGIIEGQSFGWFRTTDDFTLGPWTWALPLAPSFVALVLAGVLLPGFAVLEQRRAKAGQSVLLDLSLFRIPSFRYGSMVGAIVSLGEFGLLFALPLFLQAAYGYNALETGVVLLSLATGAFVGSGMAAPLAGRVGPVRTLRTGMVLEVIGIIGLGIALTPDGDGWQITPWLIVYGLGVGFATSQLAGIALSQVPVQQSGSASGAQSTARQLGAAVGTAVLGATLLAGLGSTTSALTERGIDQATAVEVTELMRGTAGTALPGLADEPDGEILVAGATEGFSQAIQITSWVAAAAVSVGLFATLLLPEVNPGRRRREDEDQEASAPDEGDGEGNDDATDAISIDAVETPDHEDASILVDDDTTIAPVTAARS
jgi:EmrB/QacA subfamily drug resistance transporter